ncbi:MAG: hypothetical protein P4L84_11240 [Isosphaeraceae bacterium]|nr:hypothetical protein [Isosphaeraceae bacterium]
MMATEIAATRIVAVECSYTRHDGRHMRQILLVPAVDDALYGVAVVNQRAEKSAVDQVRRHADGPVFARVHASIPLDTLTVGSGSPSLVIEDAPSIGLGTPYREYP